MRTRVWFTPLRESLCVLGGHATLVAIKRCGVDGGSGVYGRHFLIFSPKKVVSCRKERVNTISRALLSYYALDILF